MTVVGVDYTVSYLVAGAAASYVFGFVCQKFSGISISQWKCCYYANYLQLPLCMSSF